MCLNSAQTVRPTQDGVIDAKTVVNKITKLLKLLKHSPKKPVHEVPANRAKKFSLCKHAVKAIRRLILPMIKIKL